jgi:hypothetical protein
MSPVYRHVHLGGSPRRTYVYNCGICGRKTYADLWVRECYICQKPLCANHYHANLCPDHYATLSKDDQDALERLDAEFLQMHSPSRNSCMLYVIFVPFFTMFFENQYKLPFFIFGLSLALGCLFWMFWSVRNYKKAVSRINLKRIEILLPYQKEKTEGN